MKVLIGVLALFLVGVGSVALADEVIVNYPDFPGRGLTEISNGWQSDSRASRLPLRNGGCASVFERAENKDQSLPYISHLAIARSKDCVHFGPAQVLLKDDKVYFADPTPIQLGNKIYVYYYSFSSVAREAAYYRSVWNGERLGRPEKLHVQVDLKEQVRAWSHVAVFGRHVLLTHEWKDPVQKKMVLKMAWSRDGVHFGPSRLMNNGVMGKTASFANGQIIYTWQNGISGQFMDFVQFMKKGGGWTEPKPITTQKDIHDAYPFPRLDGGIDLYYLTAPETADPNVMYRRQLYRDGTFGIVERLTIGEQDGSFEKIRPFRLRDGSVLVFLAKQIWYEPNWNTDIWAMRLRTDAP